MKANEAPETYPLQFKDKIDEYLWKEHHIIGGCCSSIKAMEYSVAREVAEKFIQDYTRNCSNLAHIEDAKGNVWEENTPWLTPDQARRAVEIARKELIEKAIGWIGEIYNYHEIMCY